MYKMLKISSIVQHIISNYVYKMLEIANALYKMLQKSNFVQTVRNIWSSYCLLFYFSSTSSRGPPTWTKDSLHTLYHFMRCSQLENQNLDPYSSIQVYTLYHFMRCSQLENQILDPYSSIQLLQKNTCKTILASLMCIHVFGPLNTGYTRLARTEKFKY